MAAAYANKKPNLSRVFFFQMTPLCICTIVSQLDYCGRGKWGWGGRILQKDVWALRLLSVGAGKWARKPATTENRPSRRQIRAALKSGPQAVDLLRIIFA
jgi:hypothetical protein